MKALGFASVWVYDVELFGVLMRPSLALARWDIGRRVEEARGGEGPIDIDLRATPAMIEAGAESLFGSHCFPPKEGSQDLRS